MSRGPKAKNYLNETLFENQNINVEWFDYKNILNMSSFGEVLFAIYLLSIAL